MAMTVEELKRGRKSRGMTQRELAEAAGISLGSVNSYEQGTRNITAEAANKIEAVFKNVLPVVQRGPQPTLIADLSDINTTLQWEGTNLRPPEVELVRVVARTLVEQRK